MEKEVNIVSRDFYPDNAAVARISTELAQGLAKEFKVNVFAGNPFYYSNEKPKELQNPRIKIKRVWCPNFSKDRLVFRTISEATFAANSFLKLLFSKNRPTIITSLPFSVQVMALLLKKLRSQKFILINHEVMPELMAATKVLPKKSLLYRILYYLSRKIIDNSEFTVSIGCAMSELLRAKTKYPEKIRFIPNWANTKEVFPVPKEQNLFLKENRLQNRFVVSFSGNLGRYVDVETVLQAARQLENHRDIVFVFIGGGQKKQTVADFIEKNKSKNILLFDYLPTEQINYSLSSGDIGLVLMGKGTKGVVVQSKIYPLMAAGQPLIALTEEGNEIEKIINEAENGLIVRPGDANGLKNAVLKLKENSSMRKEFAKNSLKHIKKYDTNAVMKKYRSLVREVS